MAEMRAAQGEKIDLYPGRGPYYRTIVDEWLDDSTIIAPLPTYRGIPIILSQNQEIKMYFYRPNGRFMQNVKVIGFVLEEKIRMVRLMVLGPAEKQQRREAFRVKTMLRAILRPYELGEFQEEITREEELLMEEVPTFNISATGVAVRTSREYAVGERIYMRIFLSWPRREPEPMDIMGEVRQVSSLEQELRIKQLGIMFLDISAAMSGNVEKFVLVEQQRKVRQQRLINEL